MSGGTENGRWAQSAYEGCQPRIGRAVIEPERQDVRVGQRSVIEGCQSDAGPRSDSESDDAIRRAFFQRLKLYHGFGARAEILCGSA